MITLLVLAHGAWAHSEYEMRENISQVLSHRHPSESGTWWKSLGPSAVPVILQMYQEEVNIYRRIRLLDALAWFDVPDAVQFLKRTANESSNDVIKCSAVNSIIRSQGMREERFISKVLRSESSSLKITAARALDELEDERATHLVDEFLKEKGNSSFIQRVIIHRQSLADLKE